MKTFRRRFLSFPPVKTVRAVKWRLRTRAQLLPRRIALRLENRPGRRRRLINAALPRRPDLREIAACAARNGWPDETVEDLLWCRLAYGYSKEEYFCYGFDRIPKRDRRAFLSERESVLLSYRWNDPDGMAAFHDKYQTYRRFGAFFGREAVAVRSPEDLPVFLRFAEAHPVFTVKPLTGARGEGVEKTDLRAGGAAAEELFRTLLSRGGAMAEELIRQSGDLARFHPSSVNTVRSITLRRGNGELSYFCFLKTGRGDSFVDNGAAGGIMAGIDPLTGRLATDGIDEKGRRYPTHPDSGVTFRGFQLPDWEGLLSLCRSLAAETPAVRLTGWDLAHTDNGWILVEGNGQTELIGPQAAFGRGLRGELTKRH